MGSVYLITFYFIMFVVLLKPCSFLKRNRKGKDLDGRGGEKELERVERGETNQDVLYEGKKYFQ